ncbi:MAG: hypothetical protein ACK4MV_03415 [Beijerinckiaceae bacterium]
MAVQVMNESCSREYDGDPTSDLKALANMLQYIAEELRYLGNDRCGDMALECRAATLEHLSMLQRASQLVSTRVENSKQAASQRSVGR